MGIDTGDARPKGLNEYIRTKVYEYKLDRRKDENLRDLYQDDFKNFTEETFKMANQKELQNLRTCLRCGGVFVAHNTKQVTIARTLVDVINEDEQHKWTDQDVKNVASDLKNAPTISTNIKLRGVESLQERSRHNSTSNSPDTTQPRTPQTEAEKSTTSTTQSDSSQIETLNALLYQLVDAKKIKEITRTYTQLQKYDGSNGSFEHKLTIFKDICERVDLPEAATMRAFPIMLKGLAQDHFYNTRLSKLNFGEVCTDFRNFFEGPDFSTRQSDEWNNISLASVTLMNPEKSIDEALSLLINELRQIQYGLEEPVFRSEKTLRRKIITACRGSPACEYALSNPPDDLVQLISNLRSSIVLYEKVRDNGYHGLSHADPRSPSRDRGRDKASDPRGRCFV